MKAIESGGCAPPIIVATLADRITEYLTGEADYNVRDLLREARQELVLVAGERANAATLAAIEDSYAGKMEPVESVDAMFSSLAESMEQMGEITRGEREPSRVFRVSKPDDCDHEKGYCRLNVSTPAHAEAVEALEGCASPSQPVPPPSTPAQHWLAANNACASQDWQDGFNAALAARPAAADGAEPVAVGLITETTDGWLDNVQLTEAGKRLPEGEHKFYTASPAAVGGELPVAWMVRDAATKTVWFDDVCVWGNQAEAEDCANDMNENIDDANFEAFPLYTQPQQLAVTEEAVMHAGAAYSIALNNYGSRLRSVSAHEVAMRAALTAALPHLARKENE